MENLTIISLYLSVVATLIVVIALFFVRSRIMQKHIIMRSMNLELFLVRFPTADASEKVTLQQIRERIALMEQFYTNLGQLHDSWWQEFVYGKPLVSLELTIPSAGDELSFYVAVPRRTSSSIQKIIHGIFPDAAIEPAHDYNIFNPNGFDVGVHLTLEGKSYYPIRTYQSIEGDPMKEIANVFTKLKPSGEGAALQVVLRPADSKWRSTIKDAIKNIKEGKGTGEDTLIKGIRAVIDLFSSSKQEEEDEKEPHIMGADEEEVVKLLTTKLGKPLFEATVRLVASAESSARAEQILGDLSIAFGQFVQPHTNTFSVSSPSKRSLPKFFFDFSFRTFRKSNSIILGTDELTSIFHFPNVPLSSPRMQTLKAREAPPPANMEKNGLLLGYNSFRSEKTDIYIGEDDRRRHLYAIGQTGTGKSVFLENMIVQDIANGKGVCVIDPHGELVEKVIRSIPRSRMQDVMYFNPGDVEHPMGLNMLEYDPHFPEQKTFIVNELLSIFNKLFDMSIAGGPMFEQYFRNSTLLVMEDPQSGNTLLEIERVLTDKAFRDLKLSRSKNIIVNNFWTQIAEKAGGEASLKDMVPYIVSKFDNFLANEIMRPIIAQEKSAFNFREIMDNQKILLVNLSKGRLGDLNSSLIGLIIVGKILMAALSRADVDDTKRKDFYLYIDEFQNVTTDSIASILSEARKYHLNLIMTHQFIGQLKENIKKAVFGNVGSIAAFRIGSDDAEFLAKQFLPTFSDQDLLNIDNRNCYLKLLIHGQTSVPFSLKTYPSGKGDESVAEIIKEISRTKYSRPRQDVEDEIIKKHEIL